MFKFESSDAVCHHHLTRVVLIPSYHRPQEHTVFDGLSSKEPTIDTTCLFIKKIVTIIQTNHFRLL